jgi:hypothetical protein
MKAGARACVTTALCVVGLAGCRDNGLPDKNLPVEEARHRYIQPYLSYQAMAATTPVAIGGREWMPSLPVETIPARMLQPVGSAEGTTLFALRGDEAPYSSLYASEGGDRWRPYLRIN